MRSQTITKAIGVIGATLMVRIEHTVRNIRITFNAAIANSGSYQQ